MIQVANEITAWNGSNYDSEYEVITSHTSEELMSIIDRAKHRNYAEQLNDEIQSMLYDNDYDMDSEVVIKWLNTGKVETITIEDAIDSLATEDGYDLVEFSDGELGIIGYETYKNNNGFKIIGMPDEEYGSTDGFLYEDN